MWSRGGGGVRRDAGGTWGAWSSGPTQSACSWGFPPRLVVAMAAGDRAGDPWLGVGPLMGETAPIAGTWEVGGGPGPSRPWARVGVGCALLGCSTPAPAKEGRGADLVARLGLPLPSLLLPSLLQLQQLAVTLSSKRQSRILLMLSPWDLLAAMVVDWAAFGGGWEGGGGRGLLGLLVEQKSHCKQTSPRQPRECHAPYAPMPTPCHPSSCLTLQDARHQVPGEPNHPQTFLLFLGCEETPNKQD